MVNKQKKKINEKIIRGRVYTPEIMKELVVEICDDKEMEEEKKGEEENGKNITNPNI
jgi:hypothetical protein